MYQDDTRTRNRLRRLLVVRVLGFALIWLSIAALGLAYERERLNTQFVRTLDQMTQRATRTAKTWEVALESFRQFVGVMPDRSLEAVERYTTLLRRNYPELGLFALASRARNGGFDWLFSNPSMQHFELTGRLSPVLSQMPSAEVESASAPRISEAFALPDKSLAYLLVAPVAGQAALGPHLQALLLAPVDQLLGTQGKPPEGWSIRLLRTDELKTPELVWHYQDVARTQGEPTFGEFSGQRTLGGSPAFRLEFRYQPHWHQLDYQYLGLLLALLLTLIIVGKRWLSFSHHRTREDLEERSVLWQQAHHDQLTGLPNANLLMDRIERAMMALEADRECLLLAYLDLDNFKPVNDRWGHDAGDRLLVEVARRLQQHFRTQDTVARIHGDEFVILLQVPRQTLDTQGVADKVWAAFAEPFRIQGEATGLSTSLGIAVYPDDAQDMEGLFSAADQRMYQVKARQQASEGEPVRL